MSSAFFSLSCPALRVGALSDDARLTSACLTSVCRVHRVKVENREAYRLKLAQS